MPGTVDIGVLSGKIVLDDKFTPVLDLARTRLDKVGTMADAFGKKASAAGQALLPMSIALAGAAGLALKTFADFESGMNRVRAVTGATGTEFDALRKQALDLGATTVFTARQSAEAMGFLGLAGFKTNEILAAMPGTLQLAAAAQLEVGRAADITAKVMRGYGFEANETARINDVMVKSFTTANTDLAQLGDAFRMAGPVAKVAGIQFEETSAALSLMADAGFQGTLGGTALRGAMARLAGAVPAVTKELKALGIETVDSAGKLMPLADIVQQLEERGLTTAEVMRIFGQRAGPAMAALIERGSDALRDFTTSLEEAGGTAARIEKIQLEGLKGQFILTKSALEGMAISFGDVLAPAANEALIGLASFATFTREHVVPTFEAMPGVVKGSTVAILGLVAVAGPALIALGTTFKVVGLAASGFSGAIGFAQVAAFKFGNAVPVLTARIWLMNAATAAAGTTAGAFALAAAPVVATIAGITAAVTVGWQAWKLYSEHQERAASDARQAEIDQANMARAAELAGREFKTLDEALEFMRGHAAQLRGETSNLAETMADMSDETEGAAEALGEAGKMSSEVSQAWERLHGISLDYKDTLKSVSEETQNAVTRYLELGAAQEDLALAYELSATQVNAIAQAHKAEQDALKETEKSLKQEQEQLRRTADVWNEYFSLRATHGMSALEEQRTQIKAWFDNEVSQLDESSANWQKHYDALAALAEEKTEDMMVDWDALRKASRQSLEDTAAVAQATYEFARAHSEDFSAAAIEGFRKAAEAAKNAAKNWRTDLTDSLDKVEDKIDDVRKKVNGLSVATLHMGGQFEITGLTDDQVASQGGEEVLKAEVQRLEQLYSRYPGRKPGQNGETGLLPNDSKGWSDMLKEQQRYLTLKASGFRTGGMIDAAPGGTAITVHGKEIITPWDKAMDMLGGGKGGGDVINFYVNGTAQETARQIKDIFMQDLRMRRQMPQRG